MKLYNLISTQNIVHTGIAELDNEIVGLYNGDRTILFGTDETGVGLFLGKVEGDCIISSDPMLESRNKRSIHVYECEHREDLPDMADDMAENVFGILERDGRHYVRVCKNRMNGVHDFECEIK